MRRKKWLLLDLKQTEHRTASPTVNAKIEKQALHCYIIIGTILLHHQR